jgi:hypothetical protein
MTEIWRPVPDFPTYLVSNLGRVQGPRKILKGWVTDDGYTKVKLCRVGLKDETRTIHTLVLEAFIGPRPEGQQARHLRGVAAGNALDNLKWGTAEENSNDRKLHGTDNAGERSGRAKLTWDLVRKMRAEYQPSTRGLGSKALAKRYGISASGAHRILTNQIWRDAGKRLGEMA